MALKANSSRLFRRAFKNIFTLINIDESLLDKTNYVKKLLEEKDRILKLALKKGIKRKCYYSGF